METICPKKLERFTLLIQNMVRDLDRHNTIIVHQNIDESYYMEKAEELKLLKEQLEEAQRKLQDVQIRIHEHYKNIYFHWRKDVRWLNQHLQINS